MNFVHVPERLLSKDTTGCGFLSIRQQLVPERSLARFASTPERPFCRRIVDDDVAEAVTARAVDERSVLFGELRLPGVQVADFSHVRLQQLFQAAEAGLERAVERAPFCGDAEARRGEDRILLSMDADAEVVAFAGGTRVGIGAAVAAALFAVAHLRWRAVISG